MTLMTKQAWRGFRSGFWTENIDTADFIKLNYEPYLGDHQFLAPATERTRKLSKQVDELLLKESEQGGVLDVDTEHISSLLTYKPGYLDKDNEIIVGLQTDQPLKRSVNPFGGIRMARQACQAYGYQLGENIEEIFAYRSSHNDGVYRVYTDEMRKARHSKVITGLPDAYGRGRIIGDYRRVALYGVDALIAAKLEDKEHLGREMMTEDNIRLSEELFKQIDFLKKLKEMGKMYGCDISKPAVNGKEAVQWLYFGYLAAIKEQNGAAMSLGRVSTFLDIYFTRDLQEGTLTEIEAQEIIDDFVLKLRLARQLRTVEYNELFAGDPMWITESIGGMGEDGRTMVTKTSYRFLHTLYNLGTAPEPNLTILWSQDLPRPFKEYCAQVSLDTHALQFENDDLMRPIYGDDYGIACCVSAMKLGKQMQFFGARCNLPKLLLMALNGGKDEIEGVQVGPEMEPYEGDVLDYDQVLKRYRYYRDWLCSLYVNTMNVIHYMHDKYAYEKTQMALHDTFVERFMAFGVAGLSVLADSFSAIKYAKVEPVRNSEGLITDFNVQGEFPCYGNDNSQVDEIAVTILEEFNNNLKKYPAYRNAQHTLSVLTITSNVVYGKSTGATPDGRKAGEFFAPGANPMHGRDKEGALASLNSVAKLPYDCCRDGISNTFNIIPDALGKRAIDKRRNLVGILDGYFSQNAHHLNVNVINRQELIDAVNHPEKFRNLTIRVSGYAVNFTRLSPEQQREVIARSFHTAV